MDKEKFVQNIKAYCALRGVKPTVACRESGAGRSFLTSLTINGSIPSVEKVQLLAQYLGITTSELIGECPPNTPVFPDHPDLVLRYDQLSQEAQQEVMAFIEFKRTQETKAAKGSIPLESLGDIRPIGAKDKERLKEKPENS